MSNLNPSDPSRNIADNRGIIPNNKVIVIKNMPSFKFDPSKNFLTATNQPPDSIFKQVMQQPTQQKVIVQQATSPTILIRAPTVAKPQFTAITTCPSVKVQETQQVAVSPPQTFAAFRKSSNEFTMKTQTGQTLLLQPAAIMKTPSTVQIPTGMKSFTISTKIPSTSQKVTISSSSSPKLIPIRGKTQQVVQQPQQQQIPTHARFNAITQKWTVPGVNFSAPVPALALIQPKPIVKQVEEVVEKPEEPAVVEEVLEKTPEKPKRSASEEERLLEVKRIIEGDQDEIAQQVAIIQQHYHDTTQEKQEEQEKEEEESSQILLCDEKIDSNSPADEKKATETPVTPEIEEAPPAELNKSIEDVKKNLSLELSMECDKENIVEDSSSDESRQKAQDYEETLIKSEIAKSNVTPPPTVEAKPKRSRKPKNPTIIATLGLPYKPSFPSNRKSKVEKKLEFELDFHDPVNKIQWDDGVGGLNNCNKLFGFDEFGLIEVLSKKDVTAKLKQLEVREAPQGDFKLRKISDPADQFVCIVCNKLGTIRDFYSPECCTESCLAITKRKSGEMVRESSSESGLTTPVDERKMMFGGEMIPLQQLQQHLLEKQLPSSTRKRMAKKKLSTVPDSKFQWDTYLSAKSVPAPVSLFKNPYPRSPNPFKVGMKLEAIDPDNQRLFCVATVEEKLGFRIKLHFDGYSPMYDFWVNADSPNIFYAGFCQSTSRVLQVPSKWSSKKFDWSEYLDHTNSIGAQKAMFPRLSKPSDGNPFEVGMKLETMYQGNIYAATVIDVLECRVLIEMDGQSDIPAMWMDIYSPYLHPCNFHKTVDNPDCFVPPRKPFSWPEYLKDTGGKEAPPEFLFFRTRSPMEFEPGLKLEVVDRVNRQLIRPATVLCRNEYKIQVLFDGFDITFAYWLEDDSEDIHPINWSEKTGHPIEHPVGFSKSLDNGLCPTAGCRGIGNAIYSERFFHDNYKECPYNKENWVKLLSQKVSSRIETKKIPKTNGNVKEVVKQDVEEVTSYDDNTSSDVVKVYKQRGRKRKIAVEPKEENQKRLKISKTFLEDYGPTLNYSFNLWKRNSRVLERSSVEGKLSENPMKWSVNTVAEYITKITGDDETAMKFEDQEIDGEAFVALCQSDLTTLLGIKMGPAIKIYNRILHLREEVMLKFIKI